LELLKNVLSKVVEDKERENKEDKAASLSPMLATTDNKHCGWGGCDDWVCPHEVNFCATHADCPRCAGKGDGPMVG
jgi:hypothetical protein